MRQQIVEAISDGLDAPDAFLEAVALYRGEDRTVDYVAVPRSLVEPIEEPGESALKTWFEERKATYAAPEYRKIAYVKLDPEEIADLVVDQRRAGARRTTRAHRPLHHAGNPQDRAARLQDAGSRQGGLRFDAHRRDLRGPRQGSGQDDGRRAARHLRQGAGARPGDRRGGVRAQGQRGQPASSTARSARCCCASPKSSRKSSSR